MSAVFMVSLTLFLGLVAFGIWFQYSEIKKSLEERRSYLDNRGSDIYKSLTQA